VDARLQQRVQRYGWDKAAEFYEQFWMEQLAPAQDLLMQQAVLQQGECVLDLACGTGLVTFRAAAAVGDSGSVDATDISQSMVDLVREGAAGRSLGNVAATRSEAEVLRFPDSAFDAVLCGLGLMYVTDPVVSLREMYRVLRPGGRAVVAVWGARARCGWAEIFPIVDARVESEVCPLFFQLGTGEALTHTMSQAGFDSTAVTRISTTLQYASAQDACGAAFEGGPVALAWSRFSSDTRGEVLREYLASIEQYRRGQRFEIPGEFVVARGNKS
jgi:ubiquinone/menaquinone biosynthesis C-methylase UbiE